MIVRDLIEIRKSYLPYEYKFLLHYLALPGIESGLPVRSPDTVLTKLSRSCFKLYKIFNGWFMVENFVFVFTALGR